MGEAVNYRFDTGSTRGQGDLVHDGAVDGEQLGTVGEGRFDLNLWHHRRDTWENLPILYDETFPALGVNNLTLNNCPYSLMGALSFTFSMTFKPSNFSTPLISICEPSPVLSRASSARDSSAPHNHNRRGCVP